MEELGRRASVVVREPTNEDDGYNEDDEFADEYELDNVDGHHIITHVPAGIVVTDETGTRSRSKSKSSNRTFNGYSMYNNSIGNNTNLTTTNNNSEDEDVIDDDEDDDDDEDEDYYDDEVNNPLNYYKAVPRTLPQIDIFTQRNPSNDGNDINGVNRPTEEYFHNRNNRQVSAFLLKAPLARLNENYPNNNTNNGLLGPSSISSKTYRSKKSDRPSSKTATIIGYSTDTDSYFIKNKNLFYQNNASTISANIDSHQIIHRLVARPPVDNQDKLLAEMAMLNEVKRKASEVGIYDAFPEGIEEKLRDLRQSHVKVIQLLREREAKVEEQKRRAIQANNNALTAGMSNNTMENSMSDNDISGSDRITAIPSNSLVEARGEPRSTGGGASGGASGTMGGATSASITTSGNQLSNIVKEMPAPGLMSNPETSRYIDTLVDTIKEL